MSNSIGLIESRGLVALVEAADVILKNSPVNVLGIHKLNNGLITLAVSGDFDYVKAAVDSGAEAGRRVGEIYSFSVIENPTKELLQIFSELFPNETDSLNDSDEIISVKLEPAVNETDEASTLFKSVTNEIKSISNRKKSKPLEITRINPIRKIKKRIKDNSDIQDKSGESVKQHIEDTERITEENDISDKSVKPLSTIERLRIEALGTARKKANIEEELSADNKKVKETHKVKSSIKDPEVDFDLISQMNMHKLRNYARKFSNFPIKGREISRANRDELVELFNTLKK